MSYLLIFFASPVYFMRRKRWLGFWINSFFYGIAVLLLITILGAAIAWIPWMIAVAHGAWELRHQIHEEHARAIAKEMAQVMGRERQSESGEKA